MHFTKCDNHPDRDAVNTFYFVKMQPGSRPLLLGYSISSSHVDLCAECASVLEWKETKNATER